MLIDAFRVINYTKKFLKALGTCHEHCVIKHQYLAFDSKFLFLPEHLRVIEKVSRIFLDIISLAMCQLTLAYECAPVIQSCLLNFHGKFCNCGEFR